MALGIVEVRKGSGTYLMRPVSAETVYLPLAIVAERDALLQTLEVRRGLEAEAGALAAQRASRTRPRAHRDRGSPRWSGSTSRGHRRAPRTSPSISRSTTRATIRSSASSCRRCATPSSPSGRSRSIGRTSPAGPFPLHRPLFEAIAAGDPEAARRQTLAILAIVEEDIIRMSHDVTTTSTDAERARDDRRP